MYGAVWDFEKVSHFVVFKCFSPSGSGLSTLTNCTNMWWDFLTQVRLKLVKGLIPSTHIRVPVPVQVWVLIRTPRCSVPTVHLKFSVKRIVRNGKFFKQFEPNFESTWTVELDPVPSKLCSGSGSISQRYGSGSGSGSFYYQAKIERKTLIPTVLWWLLLDFLSLKNDVNVPSKSNNQKIFFLLLFVGVLKVNDENSRIRIRIHYSEAWIRGSGSGSTQKCHGPGTLQAI